MLKKENEVRGKPEDFQIESGGIIPQGLLENSYFLLQNGVRFFLYGHWALFTNKFCICVRSTEC